MSNDTFDGILGMDALQDVVLHINRDAGTIAILSRPPADAGVAISLPRNFVLPQQKLFDRAIFMPYAPVGFSENEIIESQIDTGLGGGSFTLNSPTFEALSKARRMEPASDFLQVSLDGEQARAKRGVISGVSVSSFRHNNLMVTEQATGNVIGLNYLARFVVTFDFPRQVMYLSPGMLFAASEGELCLRLGLSPFAQLK
jgi:hypothetical protein